MPDPGVANSEEAPAVFRSILDLVAAADRAGFRAEAERARRDAIGAYSRGWDEQSRRSLNQIEERLLRRLASPVRRRFRLG